MRGGFSSASMYIICIRLSENKSSLWIIIQASQFSTSTYEFAFQQYVKLNYMKSILDSILKLWGRKSFLELQIFYHFWLFYACRVTDKRQELTARGNPLSSGNKQKKKKKWKSKHYVNNNSLQFVYLYISVDAILYGHVCSCVYTSLHFMKQILK